MKRWSILKQLWMPFRNNAISLHSAASCCYFLISFLPASMLIFMILSKLEIPIDSLLDFMESWVPESLRQIISELWQTLPVHTSPISYSTSILTTLWSASKGISALTDGVRFVLAQERTHSFIRKKLIAVVSFLLFSISVSLVLILQIFWDIFSDQTFFRLFHGPRRMLFSIPILVLAFYMTYRILGGQCLLRVACLFGGICCTLGWLLLSWGFQIYISVYSNHAVLYGSVGILLPASVWLMLCIRFFLLGSLAAKLYTEKTYHPIRIIKQVFSRHS